MRYSIKQLDDETWELRDAQGLAVGSFTSKNGRRGYDLALEELAGIISADPRRLATGDGEGDGDGGTGDGLLPEGWTSPALALSELLPGGRDFTECEWSWRDPETSLVPLMFQSKNAGHYDADLVGFFTTLAMSGSTVTAKGRFYDTEIAGEARDTLLGDRPFGVSVDPTEKVEAEYEEVCTSWDDDGFCMEADLNMKFLSYEIGGATMHPFQGFDKAQVLLDPAPAAASSQPVKATAGTTTLSIPTTPPLEWMTLAEPAPGARFLDELSGDDVLVEQIDPKTGRVLGMACPLTIRDDGLVYGHLTYWGQCHTANPWGPGLCASAEPSADGYATFHSSGSVKCDDGTDVAVGRLVVGCEHSDAMTPELVRDHLARAGMGWANVRVTDGEIGPWVSGVLDPNLTPQQVATLRALSMSGEWVGELGGILSVNASGLPIQRAKIAASAFGGGPEFVIPQQAVRASMKGGAITKLVGSNVIGHCSECARRAAMRASARDASSEVIHELRRIGRQVQAIDDRTAHLREDAAAAAQRSLAASARS